ncbi:MAG: hypothetical protein J4215_05500 [Candidatus Diapherotrites archaeon]|uniref:Methionine--tRNA ligase n=1 Tax=Candidatus Iainarchaeum sp. TaxID=3101447 RepID=A0A8T4L8Y1_9ARCH|nr:hypothetical protein [Candidatus Diapherotrites archaeon]
MSDEISFDEFKKMDLRTATILAAEPVAGKDKLFRLSIDIGEESPRTIVSGLRPLYSVEQLVGRQIIVVSNLAARKIAGIESKGMLLAVGDGVTILSLVGLDKPMPNGLSVE